MSKEAVLVAISRALLFSLSLVSMLPTKRYEIFF